MRIELDSLEKGREFAKVYQPRELDLDEQDLKLIEPAEICGRIRRKGEEIQLIGHLRANVEAACARCLKPVLLPIASELTERFVPGVAWGAEAQHELREEDLDLAVFDGEGVELDDVVREEILLAMPGQVLCRPDCQGLCPGCGIDRNVKDCGCETREVDERWGALKDLQF
jgi:DUF177 domain-containing protein